MGEFTKVVELRGHILDSLTLPKVLDAIQDHGAEYETEEILVGRTRREPSYARIRIEAPSAEALSRLLAHLARLGADPVEGGEALLAAAPADGILPEGFHATTNLPTFVLHGGRRIEVEDLCMDCAVRVLPGEGRAACVKMAQVKAGDLVVVGREGVSVEPPRRVRPAPGLFEFMSSPVSAEKSKGRVIREIAREMRVMREEGRGKILWVAGPAVIHTGARESFRRIVEAGYVDVLFAGNGFAAHDAEAALFGTSLGVSLSGGEILPRGHEHHLRAINRVRAAGGIARAVEAGVLRDGIFHALVRRRVPFLLAGSIRDDGPLPDVVTDTVEAQRRMRELLRGVSMAVMVASMLHSIATGNLLPASVRTVCVDMAPEAFVKLGDRGTRQAAMLVTDAELFLRELAELLEG